MDDVNKRIFLAGEKGCTGRKMGYRSDVMLFAPKKCIKKIYETAVGKNFEPDVIYKSDDGLHALLWKWVKWYGHPAV